MAETINGLNEAVQNRVTSTFTPNVGGEYGGRYEGPKAKVLEKMQELILEGYAVQYECDQSPVATVTFKTPAGSGGSAPTTPNADYTDNFQVMRNTVQKELLMSDHPLVAGLDITNLTELRKIIKGEVQPDRNTSTGYSPNITGTKTFTSGSPTTSAAKAEYLLDLFLSGVTSVEVKQPVLRVTRVTNPLYDAPFDLDYVDRVLFTSTMIADSGIPSNFAIGLIALANACSRRTLLNGSNYATRTDYVGLKFGWLKDAITSETVGTTKNQYVLEYKFGLWDVETYGQPI
jgi:hypothetical protein